MTLKQSIVNELETIPGSQTRPAVLDESGKTLEQLRRWVRKALFEAHLVEVASHLFSKMDIDMEDLRILEFPVDLLDCFPQWRAGSRRGFRPCRTLGARPAGAASPMGPIRLQLSPVSNSASLALMLMRDLLQRCDAAIELVVLVNPGANLDGLRELAESFQPGCSSRVKFVEGESITIYSQDNGRGARGDDGEVKLLIPRAFRANGPRWEDAYSVEEAAKTFEVPVIRSALHWEGGNVVEDEERCFVGADIIGINRAKLGLRASEVLAILSAEFGRPVSPLGDLSLFRYDPLKERQVESAQAGGHIDMDVSVLGTFGRNRKPRALIADPARGLESMDDVLGCARLFRDHFAPPDQIKELVAAEYEAHAEYRHERLLGYCDTLESAGYQVVGLPDLRIKNEDNLFKTVNLDFGYANVVPGLWRGEPAIHHLHYGIKALDDLAIEQYQKTGARPVRISKSPLIANQLMLAGAGIRCVCSQM